MPPAIVLIDPKIPYNVGGALRACSAFGVPDLRWTGERVEDPRETPGTGKGSGRLPREERMKRYRDVTWRHDDDALDKFMARGHTPVCVEIVPGAEDMMFFEHPDDAVYVFGPEDGNVPKGVRTVCHLFVQIFSLSCLNLAASVNITLYARKVNRTTRDLQMQMTARA